MGEKGRQTFLSVAGERGNPPSHKIPPLELLSQHTHTHNASAVDTRTRRSQNCFESQRTFGFVYTNHNWYDVALRFHTRNRRFDVAEWLMLLSGVIESSKLKKILQLATPASPGLIWAFTWTWFFWVKEKMHALETAMGTVFREGRVLMKISIMGSTDSSGRVTRQRTGMVWMSWWMASGNSWLIMRFQMHAANVDAQRIQTN